MFFIRILYFIISKRMYKSRKIEDYRQIQTISLNIVHGISKSIFQRINKKYNLSTSM